MRLINADKLAEEVNDVFSDSRIAYGAMIGRQPTAFDIEEVLEQLEGQAEQYRRRAIEHEEKGFQLIADKNYSKACSYEHAIEIVKAGVKNE